MTSDILNAVCFCVGYMIWLRKRQQEDDMAALAAAHAAGDTMGQKGNMDLAFLRQVSVSKWAGRQLGPRLPAPGQQALAYRIHISRCCSKQ